MSTRPDGRDAPSFCIVTQYFPPERGAAQVRLAALARELTRHGSRVEIVTALPNYPDGEIFPGYRGRFSRTERWEGLRVFRSWTYASVGSGVRRMLNYLTFCCTAPFGLLRARRADWVLVESPPPFLAVPALAVARLRGSGVIINVADLWTDAVRELGAVKNPLVLWAAGALERWSYRAADVVTATTEGFVEAIAAKGIDRGKIRLLPNGADPELFSPGPPDPEVVARWDLAGRDVVLYAGTHGYVHNLGVALEAAADLADTNPEVLFLLVGGGSDKVELQQRAGRYGLTNVRFHDAVEPEEIAALLRIAKIGLATVRRGDFFRPVRSAKVFPVMSSATPVVYSADDEGTRVVVEADAGLATPPGDGAALAEAIRSLLADPERAEALGANGRRWIEKHQSWERLVTTWLDELPPPPGRRSRRDRTR